MNLTPYVEQLRSQLAVAAHSGGEQARALAERISAPLESGIRLMLLDALAAAADEITRELAPGTVEVRLRSGDPEFVVTLPPTDEAAEEVFARPPGDRTDANEAATARVNLRLPEDLKAGVERAASAERQSINTWLVRAAAESLARQNRPPRRRGGRLGDSYTGWVQ